MGDFGGGGGGEGIMRFGVFVCVDARMFVWRAVKDDDGVSEEEFWS